MQYWQQREKTGIYEIIIKLKIDIKYIMLITKVFNSTMIYI